MDTQHKENLINCESCGNPWPESDFRVATKGKNKGKRTPRCPACRAERAVRQRKWYEANKEKAKASIKKWAANNPDKVKARKNKESIRAWRKANPEKIREYRRRYNEKLGKGHKARSILTEEERVARRKVYVQRYAAKAREKRRAEREALGLPLERVYASRGPCDYCGSLKHYAKGLCRNCYTRKRKSGNVEYKLRPGETTAEKLSRKYVVDCNGCWAWKGGNEGRTPCLNNKNAKRIAYEMVQGKQPPGTRFLMRCGNATCINPDHMEAKVPLSKEQVDAALCRAQGLKKREAAKLLFAAGLSKQQIGERLGITRERARQLVDDVGRPAVPKSEKMKERGGESYITTHSGCRPRKSCK